MLGFQEFYLNQGMTSSPIPPYLSTTAQNKIKLTKNNVSLQFYFAGSNQLGYKLLFIVKIITPQLSPTFNLLASNIDQVSLKQAILDNVDIQDRKYITLKSFNTNKAEFYFDYQKWIADSLKGVALEKKFSFFDRSIRMAVPVPKMILFDSLRFDFIRFITAKIKEFVVKNGLSKKWFYKIIPISMQSAFNMKTQDLFNYEYDIQYNKFSISLKPEYVIAISYLIKSSLDKKEKINLSIKDPKYFELEINKNLKKYNKDDWKKNLKNKFFK